MKKVWTSFFALFIAYIFSRKEGNKISRDKSRCEKED